MEGEYFPPPTEGVPGESSTEDVRTLGRNMLPRMTKVAASDYDLYDGNTSDEGEGWEDSMSGESFKETDQCVARLALDKLRFQTHQDPNRLAPGGDDDTGPDPRQEVAVEAMKKHGYVFAKKLGAGAFATVYLVTFTQGAGGKSITLACKVINRKKLHSHFIRTFFPRELAMANRLDHPHIVKIHSIVQKMEFVFIFMECATNGDLLKFLKKNKYCSELQALVWGSQIMSAVSYMHSLQICNRDIKPENFLLSKNWNIKMADFGFARRYRAHELAETYCGSPIYCCPEILQGFPYHPTWPDIWSTGVTFYAMVTGTNPFWYETTQILIDNQLNRNYDWGGGAGPKSSNEFKDLVSKMLDPNSKTRITLKEINLHPWFSKEMYVKLGGDPKMKGGKV